MAVLYPERFKQAAPAGFDGIFEWDFLLPAWAPTKIEPMDFDAVVERHGNFLVFETKEPGASIPRGQEITLKTAVRTGHFWVVVLYAKVAEQITGWELWYLGTKSKKFRIKKFEGNAADLTAFCRRWFLWASGLK